MSRLGRYVTIVAAGLAPELAAQVRVNPTGVSVSSMSATTVYLSYGGLRNQRAVDARWCGELVSAAPAIGLRCDPATVYGLLPARYDLARPGTASYTDIMSIPSSVARMAYQAAQRGATSTFFYVRRFVSTTGAPDEYVAVTCRLTGGGARVPFSLTDVHLEFGGDDALPFVLPGEAPPPIAAHIVYTGTGRLVGRWEIVLPGEDPPSTRDLLPEAALPPEERGSQRRFAELERFNLFLPPNGRVTLPGPDVRRLPSAAEGTYRVLLRIEATDDREGDSNLGDAGAGTGIVHSGAVAGFAIPALRYVVSGKRGITIADAGILHLLLPREGDTLAAAAITLAWAPDAGAGSATEFYRVELATLGGRPLFGALLPHTSLRYEVPDWVLARAGNAAIRWRVTGLSADGAHSSASVWRTFQLGAKLSPSSSPAPPTRRVGAAPP